MTLVPRSAYKPPATCIVATFRPVYLYLHEQLQPYESEPEYTYAILSLLMNEALNYTENWSTSNGIEDAIESMMDLRTITQEFAHHICRTASEMIYRIITQHIPDYGSARYSGNVQYQMRNNHDVLLTFSAGIIKPAI